MRSRTGRTHVQDVGDAHEVHYSRWLWWLSLENHLALRVVGFAEFGPQNSAVAVQAGIGGGTWHHHGGCVEAKQLHVERVSVRSKSQELVHFAPG
jgi:hypothetical protein